MKQVRIIGAVLIVLLAGWLAVRIFMPQTPPPAPTPSPVREAFHASKPLRVEVIPAATASESAVPDRSWLANRSWLVRELRFLLARGKMKLAPLGMPQAENSAATSVPFTLRIALNDDATQATLALIAPDGIVERQESVTLTKESQLATMQGLAQHLPKFLGAPTASEDWSVAIGTTDAAAYDAFLRASDELLSPDATGFTAPPPQSPEAALNLERLETLTRRQRTFPRARSLLALAYLTVGGEDQGSLGKLAGNAAERALTVDAQSADAQAALGIVRLRRMEWTSAREHFDAALAIDASSIPALEGLGCLLMDMGRVRDALAVATRVASLQPGNRGARQCATYALIAQQSELNIDDVQPPDTARIHATMQLLAGDRDTAERLLKSNSAASDELIRAIIDASVNKARIPEALQIITRAADDDEIDAGTELLFGAALRRPDFVFNRMLRLAKQNQAVPLRMLWLPQTDFLRKHRRFKEVVSATSLATYWQDHGVPDICATEPKVTGCAVKRAP